MKQRTPARAANDAELAGFAILDDRGRVALPKATRQVLELHAGSALVYAVVDGAIVLIPQDRHLSEVAARAASILEQAGLTVDDLLALLPAARADILREEYGDAAVGSWTQRHTAASEISQSGRQ